MEPPILDCHFLHAFFTLLTKAIITYNLQMNRNIKPLSIGKRKPELSDLSHTLLKCNGISSLYSFKNLQTQSSSNINMNGPLVCLYQNQKVGSQADSVGQNKIKANLDMFKSQYEVEKQIVGEQQNLDKSRDQKAQENQNADIKKKNIYRSRYNKRSSLSKVKVVSKLKIIENKKLMIFYRHQIVTLFATLGRREQFLSSFRLNRNQISVPPMKPLEIQERLTKQLNGKGKDKTRKNFNHLTNDQLRSLKYKPKPIPTKKDPKTSKNQQEESQEQKSAGSEEQQENYPDLQTWKRKNGVGQNQRVFIVKGGYKQLRQTLIAKGWVENEQVRSKFFDMKWTTKICDINYSQLKNGQCVNHFNNNHHLTSKYGITRRLKTLLLSHGVDIDKFYPRCYDLGDQAQFENFVEGFKFNFVESVGKKFLLDKQRYKGLELKIRTVLKILKKYTLNLIEKVNKINNGQFPVIQPLEWEIITETDERKQDVNIGPDEKKRQQLLLLRKKEYEKSEQTQSELEQSQYFQLLHQSIERQLQKLEQTDPQYELNGFKNIWIAKPNFLSRGRGIRCFNNLYDIADYCLGRDIQFVIQKYIERPLLIQGKKFDIRQWVFIQDYCPPKIYFYNQSYLRFSMNDFSLQNIHNRFIHLTNNSIQKHNKKCNIDESMWEMAQFVNFVGEKQWDKILNKIKNIVVWSIKSCENSVTGKKGCFELVGFDFMIDENLNPWLIQINMSPSMDYSTPVTKKLVKMLLHDTALLISSTKSKKNVGGYTCIYESESDLSNFTQYQIKQ